VKKAKTKGGKRKKGGKKTCQIGGGRKKESGVNVRRRGSVKRILKKTRGVSNKIGELDGKISGLNEGKDRIQKVKSKINNKKKKRGGAKRKRGKDFKVLWSPPGRKINAASAKGKAEKLLKILGWRSREPATGQKRGERRGCPLAQCVQGDKTLGSRGKNELSCPIIGKRNPRRGSPQRFSARG